MARVTYMMTLLRRVFWLAVIGGTGWAGWNAWTRRTASTTAGPPEWPPIEPPANTAPTNVASVAPTPSESVKAAVDSVPTVSEPADTGPAVPEASDTGPADTGPAESLRTPALTWVAPEGGACPASHSVKANSNSGIFHVPGGRFYNQTRAERCYALAEDAEADGYRRAKS